MERFSTYLAFFSWILTSFQLLKVYNKAQTSWRDRVEDPNRPSTTELVDPPDWIFFQGSAGWNAKRANCSVWIFFQQKHTPFLQKMREELFLRFLVVSWNLSFIVFFFTFPAWIISHLWATASALPKFFEIFSSHHSVTVLHQTCHGGPLLGIPSWITKRNKSLLMAIPSCTSSSVNRAPSGLISKPVKKQVLGKVSGFGPCNPIYVWNLMREWRCRGLLGFQIVCK